LFSLRLTALWGGAINELVLEILPYDFLLARADYTFVRNVQRRLDLQNLTPFTRILQKDYVLLTLHERCIISHTKKAWFWSSRFQLNISCT
jgi:hypothetical protein